MPATATTHEASGDGEDPPLQGGDGGLLEVRTGKASSGAGEVVGHHGHSQPGRVGHELPRREVREPGALELGDPLLDHCVSAVVGLDLGEVAGAEGGRTRGSPRW